MIAILQVSWSYVVVFMYCIEDAMPSNNCNCCICVFGSMNNLVFSLAHLYLNPILALNLS